MFDFMIQNRETQVAAAPVLFLSSAMGETWEWNGIADCLGPRGACQMFDHPADWAHAAFIAPDGAHLVAHGAAAYDALRVAAGYGEIVRSVTLIDPDLIAGLPELAACLQFRRHAGMIRRVQTRVAEEDRVGAAELAVEWWMGRGAWSRTAPELRGRLEKAIARLSADWQRQAAAPFDLTELSGIAAPVRVITGRRAPSDIRAMTRLLRMVVPELSARFVKFASASAHLTDPHIVGPDVSNFIVSCDLAWQDQPEQRMAA